MADVYTGTWMTANVEVEDGVITYVGPREPAGAAIDVSGKVLVPGYIEPHTHPWCLYSPTSLLEVAVPDGTTTLVYDNLFFFLSHGVDGLREIVDAMNAAPAHIRWVARIAPQSAYPTRRSVRRRLDRADAVVAGGGGERRDHELDVGAAASRGSRRGSRPRRRRGGASRATTPARPTTASTSCRVAGISSDHEAITGDGGAGPAAARDVDDAAQVLAAAGPRSACCEGLRAGDRHRAGG